MPLQQLYPSPERILVFGQAGTGKTTNWLDIAAWSVRTQAPSRFFVLDTDFAASRMLSNPQYADLMPYIDITTGYDWPDYKAFQHRVAQHATEHDWVIIDFIGTAWSAVQQHYVEEVFHQDMDQYFLKARKELGSGKSMQVLDGWVDWSVINPMYSSWIRPLLFKGRYHVYATAQADQLSGDKKPTEDSQTRSLLLPFGVKPKGQKELLYQFHTVLLTGQDPRSKQRVFNTIKDRERVMATGTPLNSFSADYLQAIGGWVVQ